MSESKPALNQRLRDIAKSIQEARRQDYNVDDVFRAHVRIDILADQMDSLIATVQDILEADRA